MTTVFIVEGHQQEGDYVAAVYGEKPTPDQISSELKMPLTDAEKLCSVRYVWSIVAGENYTLNEVEVL